MNNWYSAVIVALPFLFNLLNLSQGNTVQGLHFYLYTKDTKTTPEELDPSVISTLTNSHFVVNAPVKILCHGFTSQYQAEFPQDLKNIYLSLTQSINVIAVDWASLSSSAVGYNQAALNARIVGQQIAKLIEALISTNLATLSNFHFIGHSLGGQVGAFISINLNNGLKIPRVTGLDPARSNFEATVPANDRLDASDADFVDVINTSGGGVFSTSQVADPPRGTVDFYPNGGVRQPGCGTILGEYPRLCSHSRAYKFYEESVTTTIGFKSCKCTSYTGCSTATCPVSNIAFMGENVLTSISGSYYLQTNAAPPYALG